MVGSTVLEDGAYPYTLGTPCTPPAGKGEPAVYHPGLPHTGAHALGTRWQNCTLVDPLVTGKSVRQSRVAGLSPRAGSRSFQSLWP